MSDDILKSMESLYAELPQIECQCCGKCCVSPTCTLTEFIYLMSQIQTYMPKETITDLICAPPTLHPAYEGNLRCMFLRDSRCTVHPIRSGACRLFGIPSLSSLRIKDLVECHNNVRVTDGKIDIECIKDWLERLYRLNQEMYPLGASPYFLKGLNIQCWLDIYFDKTLTQAIFDTIRSAMNMHIDLVYIQQSFRQQTNIIYKFDKIAAFSDLLDLGDRALLKQVLVSIRDDYPFTGTYFHHEAEQYLEALDKA